MNKLPSMPNMGSVASAYSTWSGGGRKHWPASAAELAAAMGYGTWASAWQCDEASGNLADALGGVTLSAGSTPTYGNAGAFPGDLAVGMNSVADRFVAASSATFDIGSSSIAFYFCMKSSAAVAITDLISKIEADGSAYYELRCENASGHLYAYIRSTAGTPASTSLAFNHCDGAYHDVLLSVDRVANQIQLVSDLGASTAGDISGVAAVSTTTVFCLGQNVSLSRDALLANYAYAAVATSGITGAGGLRANAATAIANIRRFTGRA